MLDLTTAFATFPVLQTERLTLRAVTPQDTADFFLLRADPQVARYFGSLPLASPEQATDKVMDFTTAFREQTGIRWAITKRGEHRLIGTCGFWRLLKEHARAEIGYELVPAYWGQGVMTEAIGAVLTFGFTAMGLHSVEAQIDPANVGSRRVLEKCGFVQEGYFRENFYQEGRFSDTAVFSLLRSAWAANERR